MSAARLGYLDALRCVATLAVLFQHVLERHDPERYSAFLALAPGVAGVVLFFYVSGYVIPLSVRDGIPAGRFVLRRVFRIYPAYLLVLAVIGLLAVSGVLVPRVPEPTAFRVLANLLLVQDYVGVAAYLGVSWTLSLEFAWYAIFALMFYRYREADVIRIVNAYSLALVALALAALLLGHRLPVGRLGMVGAALVGYATYRHRAGGLDASRYWRAIRAYLAALALSQGVMFGHFAHPNITLFNALAGWSLSSLLFLGVVHARALRESVLVDNRLTLLVGTVSYSIYLSHPVVMDLLGDASGTIRSPALVATVTLLASVAMYALVEKPGVRLGRRLEGPALVRPARRGAYTADAGE